ncbi:MAG TPA: hypothetical protein VEV17_17700 [Bryobacteraceae bacterium]|nr:hypothetical protein [Bryobacteraceae bacterium]
MIRRSLTSSFFVPSAIAVAWLTMPLAFGQAPSAVAAKTAPAPKPWTLPHLPDGHPDFEGVWTNASVTPLERPKELGAKEFYTPEEAAEHDKHELEDRTSWDRLGNQATVHYDMSQFGLDVSKVKVALSRRTSLIIGPDGRVPPLTPEARQRLADRAAKQRGHEFDSYENRPLQERCIVWANEGPPMLPAAYNSNLQIVQGDGYVGILQEIIHDARMIPTDGRPHLDSGIRQWMGDSRGHWEGDTLVVDTTNFTSRTAFRGSTETLHVVERFTRVSDDTILYEFTVDDPATWTRPWTAQLPLVKVDAPIFEYACHEGNLGMPNTLSGARAADKAAAEKAAQKDAK